KRGQTHFLCSRSCIHAREKMRLSPFWYSPQQPRGVASENRGPVRFGDIQPANAFQHARDAADLVRVVAARQNVLNAGERDPQLKRVPIEVDGVVVELLQV